MTGTGAIAAESSLRRGGPVASIRSAIRVVAGHPVTHAAVRRLALAIPLMFVVSALSFALLSLAPGDVARDILGPLAPTSAYRALRHALHLDLPLWDQYWHWLRNALSGNLGTSLASGEPVATKISQRLPVTITLVIAALLVSAVIGIAMGMVSAIKGGIFGRVVDTVALVGFSLPDFWLGVMLSSVFAVSLRWLPATGYVPFAESPSQWLRSLILPVTALAAGGVAAIAKQTREAMLEALGSEHVRLAWANGVPARSIYFRHALKGASLRILTVVGVQAVALLGGTVFVENVFAMPGVGALVVDAATQHDLPVVEGVAVYFTLIVVAVNLAIDLLYTVLDPRVRSR